MNELKVFSSTEFGELEIMIVDGKEYFPATQCARVLGYAKPADAIRNHCKGVFKMQTPTNGGIQTVNYIPEGDLYRLIVSSKLPAAEKFERWVFDEVLPSIRKTGGYGINAEELIAKTATAVVGEVMKQLMPLLQRQNEYYEPMLDIRMASITDIKPRRKVYLGTIRRLDDELRRTVDEMLLSDKFSYSDIKEYLARYGVSVSESAICRYRKGYYK